MELYLLQENQVTRNSGQVHLLFKLYWNVLQLRTPNALTPH